MPTAVGNPANPNFVEIAVIGHVVNNDGITNKNIVNVYHYRRSAGGVVPSNANVEAAFAALIKPNYAACLSVALVGDDVRTRFLDDPSFPVAPSGDTFPGGLSGDNAPTCESAYVKVRSNIRGKNYRGSKHFSPIAESSTLNQELTITAIGLFSALAVALFTNFTDADGNVWRPIILSRTLSNLTTSPASITYGDVIFAQASKTIGTMRHRKEKARY